MDVQVRAEVGRFYDGGLLGVPPDPRAMPRIALVRSTDSGIEEFALERRIAYDDRHLGEILVPGDPETFRTDLTSVPALFTWLVPKTGAHLPAALIHDGLVGAPEYVSTDGHVIDRMSADRVFRDAMGDTGTGLVRRWLVWAAVSAATVWSGSATWTPGRHLRYRAALVGTVAVVVVLGVLATLDLFDVVDVLPWMGERRWWLEVLGGLSGAVVVPFLLGATWGRLWPAGVILGVGLAVLVHVTVVLALLSGLYLVAERLVRSWPLVVAALAGLVVLASLVLTVVLTLSSA